jgi:intergrase/recombinase
MYEDETQWFSVPVYTYKDTMYGTDGYIRISLSTNTKDFKIFNPPMLNISISQSYQKSCNLNISSVKDVTSALIEFSKSDEATKPEIRRRINSTIELHILRNPEFVTLQLYSNETDYAQVRMDFDKELATIFYIFKEHIQKYYNTCLSLLVRSTRSNHDIVMEQLPTLFKGLPSQILSRNNLDSGASEPDSVSVKETEVTIADLDKFMGDKLENIKVAELDSTKEKPIQEIDSKFVKHFLKNDLRNLETILNNTSGIEEIGLKMMNEMRLNIEGFFMLPGITDEELKSLVYISQILVNTIERSYVDFDTSVPSSTPILKYKVKDFHEENLELAYDLLLFSGYIRNIRRRLEDKIIDARENKSLLHLKFRCYLDPYYFSFLEKADRTKLTSIIVNRFKYYDTLGVFNEYKNTLQMHNCPDITEHDLATFVDEVCEKVIGNSLFILEQHDKLMTQNNFRVGSNSNFTKEQIINEIVPLEVAEKLGNDTSTIEGISDEVKNFFKSKRQNVQKTKNDPIDKKSHLIRVIGTLNKDIPEKYREEFLEWINEFEKKNFVFDDKYPYSEFGDDIIKALYVWKPEDDSRIASSLKYYQTKIKEELMEKQFILALDKQSDSPVKTENLFEDINWGE